MAKVHKIPWTVHPIISCSRSISHGLGWWLDQQLKPIVKQLPSYILSSSDLKQKLQGLKFTHCINVHQHQHRTRPWEVCRVPPTLTSLLWLTCQQNNQRPPNSHARQYFSFLWYILDPARWHGHGHSSCPQLHHSIFQCSWTRNQAYFWRFPHCLLPLHWQLSQPLAASSRPVHQPPEIEWLHVYYEHPL
jgi:hypothetical protein